MALGENGRAFDAKRRRARRAKARATHGRAHHAIAQHVRSLALEDDEKVRAVGRHPRQLAVRGPSLGVDARRRVEDEQRPRAGGLEERKREVAKRRFAAELAQRVERGAERVERDRCAGVSRSELLADERAGESAEAFSLRSLTRDCFGRHALLAVR